MRPTPFRSTLTAGTIGALLFLGACGGDSNDGGGASETGGVSNEQFCERIAALEAAVEPDDIGSAVAALEGLVDAAPTDEVRNALETLIPVLSRMSTIDENDPDAIGELMELAMDPEIMEASAVLETFGTEQCGFTPES